MEKQNLPIRIREAHEGDVNFIFNSWLKAFRNGKFAKGITSTVYFSEHHKVIESLLKKQKCLIACNQEDPNQIYGFMCADEVDNVFCLHFIYVKHSFRRLGIATQLLNAFDHDSTLAGVYTHHNDVAERAAQKFNMIYHPYIGFEIAYSNKYDKKE